MLRTRGVVVIVLIAVVVIVVNLSCDSLSSTVDLVDNHTLDDHVTYIKVTALMRAALSSVRHVMSIGGSF